jgi:hypothetical protein
MTHEMDFKNRPHIPHLDSFIYMWNKRVQRTKRNVGVTFYLGHVIWHGARLLYSYT